MKKLLLLTMSFFTMLFTAMAQSTATFDFTNGPALNPAQTPSATASKGVSVSDVQFTNNGVTLVATKGGNNDALLFTTSDGSTTELRVYKTGKITVTAPTGKVITAITFSGNSVATMVPSDGNFNKGSYTGNYNTVTFAVSGTLKISTITVTYDDEGGVTPPAPEAEYSTIAELIANATTTQTETTLNADNVVVTGVGLRNGYYTTYITDGTGSAFLYGKTNPGCVKGDKLTGIISGKLCIYNNCIEIYNPDLSAVLVSSHGNDVTPEVVSIATLNGDTEYKYQSRYVRLEGVNFAADTLASSNIKVANTTNDTIVLRDNFNVLSDFVFSTSKSYNINGYVIFYKGAAQLYVCSAEDLEIISDQKDAETAWSSDTVAVLSGTKFTAPTLSTLSNGKKTFTSSDEKVATVNAEGVITFVGYGHAVITAETEETDEYLASKASCDLFFLEGNGLFENPYTAADVQYFNGRLSESVWVKGNVIGFISNTSTGAYSPINDKVVNSNLALGSEDCYVSVKLDKGSDARTQLNLVDNPTVQGTDICVYGTLETYCGIPGVKNVSAFSLDGKTITGINAPSIVDNASRTIYSLDGRRLQQPVKGINIINGKKVIVK